VSVAPVQTRGGEYEEGFRATIDVPDSTHAAEQALDSGVELRLPPGDHTLRLHIRPCDGNCDHLDAGFTCEHDISLRTGEQVELAPSIDVTHAPQQCAWSKNGPTNDPADAAPATFVVRAIEGAPPIEVGVDRPATSEPLR
jgi:hypothetical protein